MPVWRTGNHGFADGGPWRARAPGIFAAPHYDASTPCQHASQLPCARVFHGTFLLLFRPAVALSAAVPAARTATRTAVFSSASMTTWVSQSAGVPALPNAFPCLLDVNSGQWQSS